MSVAHGPDGIKTSVCQRCGFGLEFDESGQGWLHVYPVTEGPSKGVKTYSKLGGHPTRARHLPVPGEVTQVPLDEVES